MSIMLFNYNNIDDFNSATYSVRWQELTSTKQAYIKHKYSMLTLTEATVLMLVCEI